MIGTRIYTELESKQEFYLLLATTLIRIKTQVQIEEKCREAPAQDRTTLVSVVFDCKSILLNFCTTRRIGKSDSFFQTLVFLYVKWHLLHNPRLN